MKGANISNLIKQAQEMQSKMQEAQEQLARMIVTGEAGGGLVKVNMNGKHEVQPKGVIIDPSLLQEEKEMLEDLIAAAINDAVHKVEKVSREKLTSLTSGLQLPEGFGGLGG